MNSLFFFESRSASAYVMSRELAAEGVPQVRRAVGLEGRQELGQQLVPKQFAVHLDVQERTYEMSRPRRSGFLR